MGRQEKIPSGLLTRQIAVEWLYRILQQKKSLDEVLLASEEDARWQKLEPRDKGFVRLLVMTALRRKGEIDWLLGHFLEKKPQPRTRVAEILLSGVVQLLYMDVPDHAAIDMSVRLAKHSDKSRHMAKLVNAILRKVTRESEALMAGKDHFLRNFPDWILQGWRAQYGEEATNQICKALLLPAALDLSVKENPPDWAEKLGGTVLIGNSIRIQQRGAIPEIEGFAEGGWWVQDVSASLAVPLFGTLQGKTTLDICAAPGGKTAALVLGGADVTALDISKDRMARLTDNLERLQLKAELIVEDVLTYQPQQKFDVVLLDAPCSATGTIRRHPDILHLKTHANIQHMQKIQQHMLEKAASFVKPGGTLIYCTCSLEVQEGEAQIKQLLSTHNNLCRNPVSVDEVDQHDTWVTDEGDLRLLPHYSTQDREDTQGMDGFFISRITVN